MDNVKRHVLLVDDELDQRIETDREAAGTTAPVGFQGLTTVRFVCWQK